MGTSNQTQPVGFRRNSAPLNTEVSTAPAGISRPRVSATGILIHGLEDDRELYERVIQRVRTTGETVPIEQILGDLDECATGPSEAD